MFRVILSYFRPSCGFTPDFTSIFDAHCWTAGVAWCGNGGGHLSSLRRGNTETVTIVVDAHSNRQRLNGSVHPLPRVQTDRTRHERRSCRNTHHLRGLRANLINLINLSIVGTVHDTVFTLWKSLVCRRFVFRFCLLVWNGASVLTL